MWLGDAVHLHIKTYRCYALAVHLSRDVCPCLTAPQRRPATLSNRGPCTVQRIHPVLLPLLLQAA